MDFSEESATYRIGDRIRKIRKEKGLSQASLGSLVGLSADRIQKYENGARRPKHDLLDKIAEAMGVSPLALMEPTTTSPVETMFALFDLENIFDMEIEKITDHQPPVMCLKAEFGSSMYNYMEEWYEVRRHTQARITAATSNEEKEEILKSYHNWQWNFPHEDYENVSYIVDGITSCCGYDFGTDSSKARFCPICGKPLKKPNRGFRL